MKNAILFPLVAGILCAPLTVSGGCARSPSARFYTLNALAEHEAATQGAGVEQGVAVGLGPVRFPEYLDRPQIVTRVSANEVEFAEFHRWAAPLEDNLPRAIAGNLSVLLNTDRVALYPWTAATPVDYQVKIDVIRFDGWLGKSAVLQTKWAVFGKDPARALRAGESTLEEPIKGQGYEALVAAHSRTLAGLSREIAEAVKAVCGAVPHP